MDSNLLTNTRIICSKLEPDKFVEFDPEVQEVIVRQAGQYLQAGLSEGVRNLLRQRLDTALEIDKLANAWKLLWSD